MWVLIYWVITTSNSMTGTATFGDQASCKAALQEIISEWSAVSPSLRAPFGIPGGTCSAASSYQPAASQ